MKKILSILTAALLTSSMIFASGFQINEHGAKAMALGGAFAGLANDPSAIYFNPAGITQLTGTHFMGGATLIVPKSSFRGPSPSITEYNLDNQYFNPINFYITHQLTEKFHIGVGVYNPYGLGTRWPSDWVGKYMAIETKITTFYATAVAAYEVSPKLSLAFGYTFAYGDVTITRDQNLSPFNGNAFVSLTGNGTGAGWTLGVLYKPSKYFSLGASYRSRVHFKFTGDATATAPSQLKGLLPTGSISAPLTPPDNWTIGIVIKPSEKFLITADFQYVGWDSYNKLEVTFNDFIDSETGKPLVSSSERNFNDGYITRLGTEYVMSDLLTLRGGIFYDVNPIDDWRLDPTLPDANRIGFNAGVGIHLSDNLSLDLGYLFLRFDERTVTNSLESYSGIEGSFVPFNGVYTSSAHLIAADFSYNF